MEAEVVEPKPLKDLVKIALSALEIDQNLTYTQLSTNVGAPRHGPDGWEFALIEAIEELETSEGERPAMFYLRCGSRIGIVRISANDAASEALSRRRRHIVRKANRGLRQARAIAQDPDLSAEYKAYLGAQAASLAVVASAGQKFSGLGTGSPRPKISRTAPDWDGLKALYED